MGSTELNLIWTYERGQSRGFCLYTPGPMYNPHILPLNETLFLATTGWTMSKQLVKMSKFTNSTGDRLKDRLLYEQQKWNKMFTCFMTTPQVNPWWIPLKWPFTIYRGGCIDLHFGYLKCKVKSSNYSEPKRFL